MIPRCPECGDNHIKMIAHLGATGEVKNSGAQCANGHLWEPFPELKTQEESATLEALTRRDNDV